MLQGEGLMFKRLSVLGVVLALATAAFPQDVPDTAQVRSSLLTLEKLQLNVLPTTPRGSDAAAEAAYKKQLLKTLIQATDHMARGTRALSGFEHLLVGHVSLTNATSPWNDIDIRNWYDEIKDWGTIAGSLVAAYAFVAADGDNDNTALKAGSVGLVGLSQLTGRLFGNASSNRLKEKAAFLDMTVQAYDDMLAHRRHLENLIAKNEDATNGRIVRFEKSKAALPAEDAVASMTNDVLLAHVTRVETDLSEYESAIRELLALSDSLEAMAGGYLLALDHVYTTSSRGIKTSAQATATKLETSPATSKAQEDLRAVIKGLQDFKTKHAPAVYDFFNVNLEIRNALKDANVTLRMT